MKIKLSSPNKCKQHAGLLLNQSVMNPLLITDYFFRNLWFRSPHSAIHSAKERLPAPCSRSVRWGCWLPRTLPRAALDSRSTQFQPPRAAGSQSASFFKRETIIGLVFKVLCRKRSSILCITGSTV